MKIVFIVLTSAAVFAQTSPPPRAEFEVASIKPSGPPEPGQFSAGLRIDGAQLHAASFSLKDYIRMAYRVKDYQISGPDWMASTRFEIAAKLPAAASREQVGEMLQGLLADRFKMKLHRDTKEFPVYGLVVAKGGPKVKESVLDAEAEGGAGKAAVDVAANATNLTVSLGRGSYFSMGNNRFEAKKLTMSGFAETLARFVDRPVVDMTELKGTYDFQLELTPEDFRNMQIRAALVAGVALPPEALKLLEGASDGSLHSALQALGLKLEPRKAPVEVLVIDHIEKTPSEN